MAQLRNIVITLSLMLFFASCGEQSRQQKEYLSVADSLIDVNPDSVYRRLLADSVRFQSVNENIRMRYLLLTQKALNKSKAMFHSDSIIRTVVNYYADNGTANEQMLSRYILACAYVDLNESPRALDCFYEALSCADTTAADCDYTTMSRIVAQMKLLFDNQNMPQEEIKLYPLAVRYSLLSGDTLGAIDEVAHLVDPYYLLQQYDSVLSITTRASELYRKYGYEKDAASGYALAIEVYVMRKQYHEADSLIKIFETQSGRFCNGELTDVEGGGYYYVKGIYYQGIGNLEKAEDLYRLSLKHKSLEAGYKGLLSLYTLKHNADSMAKYATLFANTNDSNFYSLQTEAVAKQSALYNYERNERLAKHYENKSKFLENEVYALYTIVTLIVIIVLMITYNIIRYRKRIKRETLGRYRDLLRQYNNVKNELCLSEQDKEKWVKEKNDELNALVSKISQYKSRSKKRMSQLASCRIVNRLHDCAIPSKRIAPTDNDWDTLMSCCEKYVPALYKMLSDSKLAKQEQYASVLLFLDFEECEMAQLFNASPQRITNLKKIVNNKLFGETTAKTVKENIRGLVSDI